jgi:hypothetical protein
MSTIRESSHRAAGGEDEAREAEDKSARWGRGVQMRGACAACVCVRRSELQKFPFPFQVAKHAERGYRMMVKPHTKLKPAERRDTQILHSKNPSQNQKGRQRARENPVNTLQRAN